MSTFRTMDGGRPILWKDGKGVVHSCEASNVHVGTRLIWTDCQRDVPANGAYLPATSDEGPNCAKCAPRASDAAGDGGV